MKLTSLLSLIAIGLASCSSQPEDIKLPDLPMREFTSRNGDFSMTLPEGRDINEVDLVQGIFAYNFESVNINEENWHHYSLIINKVITDPTALEKDMAEFMDKQLEANSYLEVKSTGNITIANQSITTTRYTLMDDNQEGGEMIAFIIPHGNSHFYHFQAFASKDDSTEIHLQYILSWLETMEFHYPTEEELENQTDTLTIQTLNQEVLFVGKPYAEVEMAIFENVPSLSDSNFHVVKGQFWEHHEYYLINHKTANIDTLWTKPRFSPNKDYLISLSMPYGMEGIPLGYQFWKLDGDNWIKVSEIDQDTWVPKDVIWEDDLVFITTNTIAAYTKNDYSFTNQMDSISIAL